MLNVLDAINRAGKDRLPNVLDANDSVVASVSGALNQKISYGSGSLVTGSAVIATGLASVLGFAVTLNGPTGFATGATEVSGLLVSSITTGAVTIKGIFNAFVTGAATISVSGTAGFTWVAIGT